MLFIFIKGLYWLMLSLCYGAAITKLGSKLTTPSGTTSYPAPVASILGLAVLSLIPALLNFFIPIGLVANGVSLLLGVIAAIWAKQHLQQLLAQWRALIGNNKVLTAVVVLLVCGLASRQSIWIDEGVYHAQYIKWIETYKIIPGLGNVQHRFAFNSHWHVLAALMNGSFVTGQESNHINSLIYLLGAGSFFWAAKQQSYLRYLGIGFLLAMHLPFIMCYHIIAPSADYALLILGWVMILLAVEKWQAGRFWDIDMQAWAMLIIAAFAITVKVSSAPLALLPALIWLKAIVSGNRWKLLVVAATVCLLFWLPWLGRNYILSGSLVFPVRVTALSPEWAIGEPLQNDALEFIVEGGYSLYRPDRVLVSPNDALNVRLQKWFLYNLRIYDRVILITALLMPLLLIGIRDRQQHGGQLLLIVASSYLGVVYWLFTAPDPRFGLAYLIPLGLLGIIPFIDQLLQGKSYDRFVLPATLLVVLSFWAATFAIYTYLHDQFAADGRVVASTSVSNGLLMPYPYPTVHRTAPNGFSLAENGQTCWDAPIPCMEYYDPHVVMLGSKLQDGFGYKYDTTE